MVSNHDIETKYLEPCKKQEADDRMFLHALEMSRLGLKKLLIVNVDIDFVVIALTLLGFGDWVEFSSGKGRKWQPVHAYTKSLGQEICKAILFWYDFTDCDTVCQFLEKGKKTAWNTWGRFLEATETFIRPSSVSKPSDSDIKITENFVVLIYDVSCPHTRVNDCWKYLFSKLNRTTDQCLPTKDALE